MKTKMFNKKYSLLLAAYFCSCGDVNAKVTQDASSKYGESIILTGLSKLPADPAHIQFPGFEGGVIALNSLAELPEAMKHNNSATLILKDKTKLLVTKERTYHHPRQDVFMISNFTSNDDDEHYEMYLKDVTM